MTRQMNDSKYEERVTYTVQLLTSCWEYFLLEFHGIEVYQSKDKLGAIFCRV
jgi:hypothetical protein